MIVLDDRGTLRIKGDIWQALSAEQRAPLVGLARIATGCAGEGGEGRAMIFDIDTGVALSPT